MNMPLDFTLRYKISIREKNMSDNIKDFFEGYQGNNPAFVNRVCNEVMRNGIADMDSLCRMLKKEPNKLLQMRNIGPISPHSTCLRV